MPQIPKLMKLNPIYSRNKFDSVCLLFGPGASSEGIAISLAVTHSNCVYQGPEKLTLLVFKKVKYI